MRGKTFLANRIQTAAFLSSTLFGAMLFVAPASAAEFLVPEGEVVDYHNQASKNGELIDQAAFAYLAMQHIFLRRQENRSWGNDDANLQALREIYRDLSGQVHRFQADIQNLENQLRGVQDNRDAYSNDYNDLIGRYNELIATLENTRVERDHVYHEKDAHIARLEQEIARQAISIKDLKAANAQSTGYSDSSFRQSQ